MTLLNSIMKNQKYTYSINHLDGSDWRYRCLNFGNKKTAG